MNCPHCGQELPGEFPFCPYCGAALGDGHASEHEERKIVSVLFCDLVGSTAAADGADPEDVRARIRPYHASLRREIETHGGTVEKFVGDAVMAVFGAPVAHEDDAERAVRCGLAMLEAIGGLNDADPGLGLQVRIGVSTGEAVVALGVRPELGEGIVTGDVVNTASRLQGTAPVDGVAVSETTFRHTERVFEYEALGVVTLKGKVEPLTVFRPLSSRARFGADSSRMHSTPLVGRELEKPLLIGTFERAAGQRSCQLVTIVGEPGVGKSRLCAELGAYIDERPGLVRWREGRCLPYGEGVAFWALGEIVKAECGILESDSPEEAASKLELALPPDDPDLPWLRARLAPLVGAGSEPAAQEESFTAWRRFLEGLAAERATVLVFEDLHWADPALLAFLEHLVDWAQNVPLLVVCTARPELREQHAGWGAGLRNAVAVNLPPLTDEETATLLSALLRDAVLPAETLVALLERAGGNPLYAEEFVRLLGERQQLTEAAEVPESVQALIAARLDTLPPERKSLLQDAAVVGKMFWAGALVEMGGRDPRDVEQALHELSRKELVRSARISSMAGEREYGFWHLLVRDVCYSQLPRAARASRHLSAASWIEQRAGERAEDLADVLADHYTRALDLTRAAGRLEETERLEASARRFLTLAGERALVLDVDAAEASLARALELTPAGHPARAHLLERWAEVAQQQGRLQEAIAALDETLGVYRKQSDAPGAGRVLTSMSRILRRYGDRRREELLTEALALLESHPPGAELVAAYAELAANRYVGSAQQEAITAAERALALADELGLEPPARALGYLGGARSELGDAGGNEVMRQGLALALEQGKGRDAAVLYNNLAIGLGAFEGPQKALETCRMGADFCTRRGIAEIALTTDATSLLYLAQLGRCEEVVTMSSRLAGLAKAAGDPSPQGEALAAQLRVLSEQGRLDDAPDQDELVAIGREVGDPQDLSTTFPAAAMFLQARGESEQARRLLAELAQTSAAPGDTFYAANLPALVRCALALGDNGLAAQLADPLAPRVPLQQHALASCSAQLAEAAGDHAGAAALYADVAERWREFGEVPEQAYAELGRGRCLVALDDSGAAEPLRRARELFESMGYRPALAETEALLERG